MIARAGPPDFGGPALFPVSLHRGVLMSLETRIKLLEKKVELLKELVLEANQSNSHYVVATARREIIPLEVAVLDAMLDLEEEKDKLKSPPKPAK
jgi:hypothetical protein